MQSHSCLHQVQCRVNSPELSMMMLREGKGQRQSRTKEGKRKVCVIISNPLPLTQRKHVRATLQGYIFLIPGIQIYSLTSR